MTSLSKKAAYQRWRKAHPLYHKTWKQRNRVRINKQSLDLYHSKKGHINKQRALRRLSNLDKAREQGRRNYMRHRPSRLAYQYNRRKTHPQARIAQQLRVRLWGVLKRSGAVKSDRTSSLVGCSWNVLCQWLESQFRIGMSWENYGFYGWHIDHIVPCARFDLTNPAHQVRCFHYTNLQPLWRAENQAKGDKMPEELAA